MIVYDRGKVDYRNWIIAEDHFDLAYQSKCESIMALGNGYLGLRSAFEEGYTGQTRNLFVAGTYNKADSSEVTELPNAADLTKVKIELNGESFSLQSGKLLQYSRMLNMKDGELVREILWESPKKSKYRLIFRRFVSLYDMHFIAMKISIVPIDNKTKIRIKTGIDGRMTNSGSQHFRDGEKRVYDRRILHLIQSTNESRVDFIFNSCCACYMGDTEQKKIEFSRKDFALERRSIHGMYEVTAGAGEGITFEKISNVFTSRDKQFNREYSLDLMRKESIEHIQRNSDIGYDHLFESSKKEWHKYWSIASISLESENNFDILALRFAQYHLRIMTPWDDERFSAAAKGLTGEGYKGHIFWDTEIFMLPFFQYTFPDVARNLLKYRFLTLEGARNKAASFGYNGAMYPWETAFTGEEETPEWAAINILTGNPTRVWSGLKEHHITADISYALRSYYDTTRDYEFMMNYGYEIIFECAWFWCSRVKWNESLSRFEILDVIGPDEYTEHVDNNAFTNYMAVHSIKTAIKMYDELHENNIYVFDILDKKLGLQKRYKIYMDIVEKLYLPGQNENGIIPQDDSFLSKDTIDITKYRNSEMKQSILLDYSRSQVIELQVLKQADLVMLFQLFKNLFDPHIVEKNWRYYEKRTIHDSSLSVAVHSIVATHFGDMAEAYRFFCEACKIDLGPNSVSSDTGIHAAAMGGIWQAVVFGFGGVHNDQGLLEINPCLPREWSRLSFKIAWKKDVIEVTITDDEVKITSLKKSDEIIQVCGKKYSLKSDIVVELLGDNNSRPLILETSIFECKI